MSTQSRFSFGTFWVGLAAVVAVVLAVGFVLVALFDIELFGSRF